MHQIQTPPMVSMPCPRTGEVSPKYAIPELFAIFPHDPRALPRLLWTLEAVGSVARVADFFCYLSSFAIMLQTLLASTAHAPCPVHRRPASGQTNTTAPGAPRPEHGRVPQHVGHDEVSDMRAADIDLFEMRDAAVARRDGDVFELDVHVVFGCWASATELCIWQRYERPSNSLPR